MSFGLFDVPVWFVGALSDALQQFAYLFFVAVIVTVVMLVSVTSN